MNIHDEIAEAIKESVTRDNRVMLYEVAMGIARAFEKKDHWFAVIPFLVKCNVLKEQWPEPQREESEDVKPTTAQIAFVYGIPFPIVTT
jgi:hypothetical protein